MENVNTNVNKISQRSW